MRGCVLRLDSAPTERVAQEKFDLRVDAAQFALSEPLEHGPQRGIYAQQKCFLLCHALGWRGRRHAQHRGEVSAWFALERSAQPRRLAGRAVSIASPTPM